MQITKSKKVAAALGAGAMVVAASGVAYAYISGGTGTGTGNASTASNLATDLTVAVTPPASALVPGANASGVTITVTNSKAYSVHFKSLGVALGTLPVVCQHSSPAWIVLGGTTTYDNSGAGYTVSPGTPLVLSATTVAFADDPNNDQTACEAQSANLPIVATISNA